MINVCSLLVCAYETCLWFWAVLLFSGYDFDTPDRK